ncbi:unnamed protein product [Dovyalis caffra]|uniref:Chlororespiratory reduction 2 n=1 Tax=Dovyalis caffra TaxID=77055 RepID=A0AAV1S420_9ROSI|nr:unnamed protein product [Dovyalis caffra]
MATLSSSTPFSASKTPQAHNLNSSREFSLLSKLHSCKSVSQLKQIHAFIIKTPKTSTHHIYAKKLIYSLLQLQHSFSPNDKNLTYAYSLVKQWEKPDVYAYNAIIQRLSSTSSKNSMQSFHLYQEMLIKGIFPDAYTIPYVLKACSQSLALREGQQIHSHCIKMLFVENVYVNNTLMRLYAVCGMLDAVEKLFEQGPVRDLVSWTTLIQAYLKMGFPKDAVLAFFRMCQTNLRPDNKMLVVVLSACSRLGDLSLGRKIHEYMDHLKVNVNSDVFLGNALVDMYLKCREAGLARQMFDKMPVKNVVSWNSMISGLAHQGQFKEALDVFRWMQKVGLKPDDVTLVAVLNSCANLGMLELGKWVHAYIDKSHIKADGFIGNALVDMYAKSGSIDQAFGVFQAMKFRDVYSYTAMIVGLAMHGEVESALNIFSEMPRMGIRPDEVTFVGVLSACSHAGLVKEGWRYFEDISKVYNLEPQAEHYGCVVDLLGRAGLISEAQQFIQNMPIAPDAFVWGALLGACKMYAKVELGENIMEKLLEVEPRKDGAYTLMSNMYSSANRWRDALKWRKAMKERKIKKTPGCSSIEVDGLVHEFRKGEKAHPKVKELYKLLEAMNGHLRNYGIWSAAIDYVDTTTGCKHHLSR